MTCPPPCDLQTHIPGLSSGSYDLLRCHTPCRAGSRWERPRDEWELDLRVPKSRRERSPCPLGSRSSWGTETARASWSPGPGLPGLTPQGTGLLCTSHLQVLVLHPLHQLVTQGQSEGLRCVSRGGTKESSDEMPPRASGWGGSGIPAAPLPHPGLHLRGCWASPTTVC